ncbi:SirB2 family protein [Rufibacter roseus]|uniref:SirB2 family protein n=1 Tax=Rufibacter roseus TaxID=1567108 RepID=A0ABW2DH65_9BACT|nr:SirB2 family protein [Rufibacter roseus]
MTTPLLHSHLLVVILFLLLFLYKVALLFMNKSTALDKARSYTKMLDIVFGLLILVTGAWLAFSYNGSWPTWLGVKILLVLAAIPLAIVGIKKHSKILAGVSLLIFLYVYGVAETKSLKMRPDKREAAARLQETSLSAEAPTSKAAGNPILSEMEDTQLANTKAIYSQVCATCHGEDGQKGTGGASNLQQSELSAQERKEVIANGSGLMPGYRSQLTEQEIEALAQYTLLMSND